MRLRILFVFFGFTCCLIYAQTRDYEGFVLDANSKEIIPFATLAIYNNDKLISGTTTNENGAFKLRTKDVITHFEVSFIGYHSAIIKRSEIENIKNIQILIRPSITELNEVVVQGEQTTSKLEIDRRIINFGADIQQTGTTTLEAFDQITEIQTDLGTGTMSLRGSGNVKLLVNGKPSSINATELLEQIPASLVQRVEIITSPSAKNQADGLSGIINVILKKNRATGLNANLNAGVGTKRYSYRIDGNYNFSWINFRWNVSQAGRGMDSRQTISQLYENGDTRDFITPHDFNGLVRKVDTGLDFFFNGNNVLSIGVDYTDDSHNFFNETFYSNVTGREDYIYVRNSSHSHKTVNANANYRIKFDQENHFLEADYQFTKNNNLFPAMDFEEGIFLFDEERRNDNILKAFALDYSLPIASNILVEVGGAWNGRSLTSSLFTNLAEAQETFNIFKYDESCIYEKRVHLSFVNNCY